MARVGGVIMLTCPGDSTPWRRRHSEAKSPAGSSARKWFPPSPCRFTSVGLHTSRNIDDWVFLVAPENDL